jgi:hypothetical protein
MLAGGPRGDIKVGCVMGGRDYLAERQEMQEAPAIHMLVRERTGRACSVRESAHWHCACSLFNRGGAGVYGRTTDGSSEEGRHAAHTTGRASHAHT